MNVPSKFVIDSTLRVGVVYKFDAPELIETDIPHYFIVVGIESDNNYLVVCTTKWESRLDYITKKGYDPKTLALIIPSESNGLTAKSYVDCNKHHTISKQELIAKVETGKFSLAGNVSKDEYQNLCDAIALSYVNDLPKYLLKYPS